MLLIFGGDMNREKFHNELATRLGCERIVKGDLIQITVEESDNPWVILKVDGSAEIRFRASEKPEIVGVEISPKIFDEINLISGAVQQAFFESTKEPFGALFKKSIQYG